jgi:hypothetical protein
MILIIVHSAIVNNTELIHNIQCNNVARLKQVRRLMLAGRYELYSDEIYSDCERGLHSFSVWSLADVSYTFVPRFTHVKILDRLHIPAGNVTHKSAGLISTYKVVGCLRRMLDRRPSRPLPMRPV